MRAYIIGVIFISALHIYYSIQKAESPLNVFLVILLLVPFVPYIWNEIANIKLGKDGLELQRLKSDVDKTIKRAVHGKGIPPSALDDLFKTTELNEWLTLVLARMLMRQGLVCLIPNHGLGVSPSLKALISSSLQKGLISQGEHDDLEKLRDITFYAEWWDGTVPTHEQWEWALSNCKRIIRGRFAKQPVA
jgi:hypothetical protein